MKKPSNRSSEKEEVFIHRKVWNAGSEQLLALVRRHLEANPHHLFVPLSDLRSQFLKGSEERIFRAILEDLIQKNILYRRENSIGLSGWESKLGPKDKELTSHIEEKFRGAGFGSPLEEEVRLELGLSWEKIHKIQLHIHRS